MKNTLRISLDAAQFPFLYEDANRSTILPGLDMNVRHPTFTGSYDSYDWGAPSILYCENVMPIAKGLISVAFTNTIPPRSPAVTDFDQAITLRDSVENTTLLVPAKGKNYILDIVGGNWNSSHAFTATGVLLTRAYTQGRTFICYEKEKIFEYDGGTNTLIDRTASIVFPSGYSMADVRGIGGASNYLLLFTDLTVLWSSPSDPVNFDRATNNGSGYQIPQDLRGRISCILPVAGGAVIYTVRNAVAITFTNNAATPFVFRGIPNSGGVASYEQVAYDGDEKYQYVWGSGGLQRITLQQADGVWPEVSDFLTAGIYEEFDYSTFTVGKSQLSNYLSVKLTYVSQRFLVISYGASAKAYTYALIFDTILQRWGKVKQDHVDAFTYPYPNILGDLTYAQLSSDISGLGDSTIAELGVGILNISPPKKSIAFLQKDGTINILAIDYRLRGTVGVAIMGHIQHNRDRMTTLHQVELTGIDDSAVSPHLYDLISYNGGEVNTIKEYLTYEQGSGYRRYLGDSVGKTHQLALIGTFQLTNLLVQVAKHGRS